MVSPKVGRTLGDFLDHAPKMAQKVSWSESNIVLLSPKVGQTLGDFLGPAPKMAPNVIWSESSIALVSPKVGRTLGTFWVKLFAQNHPIAVTF